MLMHFAVPRCRFFAESCATLVCQVFGRRCRKAPPAAAAAAVVPSLSPAAAASPSPEPSVFDYYITDGLYGSFNCIMYDHAQPTARPLRSPMLPSKGADRADNEGLFPSTVFGPSCDGLDTVFQVRSVHISLRTAQELQPTTSLLHLLNPSVCVTCATAHVQQMTV